MSKLYDLLNTIIGKVNKSVKTDAQTLTEEQKAQARSNIGAAAEGEGGSGGVSVQSDWNEFDESNPAHVKNRTHHDAFSPCVFSEVVEFDAGEVGVAQMPVGIPLSAGKTYTILYDGNEYSCEATAFDMYGGMITGVMIGEVDIGTGSIIGDHPFCVMAAEMDGECSALFMWNTPLAEATTTTVSILDGGDKEEYHTLSLAEDETPLNSNYFLVLNRALTDQDYDKGFTVAFKINGEEQIISASNNEDAFNKGLQVDDGYLSYRKASLTAPLVLSINESGVTFFFNDTQAGLTNSPQVDMKSLTFTAPVFAPSIPLKPLDAKYLPNNQLYTDGTYLYKNSDTSNESNRISQTELGDLVETTNMISIKQIRNGITAVYVPSAISFGGGGPYGSAFSSDGVTSMKFYTAEYTGS